ncbi:MAG: hypothetical protein WDM94_10885 [Bauldia sp.]
MGKINAAWHDANPMPKNPTLDQRIAWHVAHARHCGCRPVPDKLGEEMVKRGIKVPVFKG